MKRVFFVLLCAALVAPTAAAQEEGFDFTILRDVATTSVKNQGRTGTCWSFASSSFMETELLRMGKEGVDLSEMYFVRVTYPQKVANYVRLHGSTALGQGSLAGDVIRAIRKYGAVPQEVYEGRRYGAPGHDHSELFALVQAAADALVERRQLSPAWPDAIDGILDAYLGPDDYVELTSFTHHAFNTWFAIEVPDNWARNKSYNVPLDDLMSVIDNALENGYSVDWDGDVSERSFCHSKGVAVLPLVPWASRSSEEQGQVCGVPQPELTVTPEVRQQMFDNYASTDDHLMHLVGIARDQNGTKYYVTKNSWGETGAEDGYVYMSEQYVRAKTVSIMVHRDALPRSLRGSVAEE